jgi:hypothetical protein
MLTAVCARARIPTGLFAPTDRPRPPCLAQVKFTPFMSPSDGPRVLEDLHRRALTSDPHAKLASTVRAGWGVCCGGGGGGGGGGGEGKGVGHVVAGMASFCGVPCVRVGRLPDVAVLTARVCGIESLGGSEGG